MNASQGAADQELPPSPPPPDDEEIVLKIVSAFYGPCEGGGDGTGGHRNSLTGGGGGEIMTQEALTRIPFTRDVTPILRALLQRQAIKHGQQPSSPFKTTTTSATAVASAVLEEEDDDDDDPHLVRLKAISGGGMKRSSIPIQALHDGCNSMNVVFGDACPGTSKKLHIQYLIRCHTTTTTNIAIGNGSAASIFQQQQQQQQQLLKLKTQALTTSEIHQASFAEYEPVILRRRVTFYQDDEHLQQATARVLAKKKMQSASTSSAIGSGLLLGMESVSGSGSLDIMDVVNASIDVGRSDAIDAVGKNSKEEDEDEHTLLVARRMGRSDSILEFAELSANNAITALDKEQATSAIDLTSIIPKAKLPPSPSKRSRLRSATFEIVLPVVLSFLQIQERVQCRLICRLWRNIVRDWGVASVIDSTDPTLQHAFTRPFIRGLLSHSYSSLVSLRLSDFREVRPEDVHPSIPHLRKLRVLDISRCIQLQDETLIMLAQHVSSTLEVLYIKGLSKVSDTGLLAICESCTKLKVLEVSHIPITDESGVAIGTHLTNLRALYMRDNFRLTNKSIDIITANCTKLNQLTLWGCAKLQHISFDGVQSKSTPSSATGAPTGSIGDHPQQFILASGNLVSLSLWGCLKLGDNIAMALGNMKNLRSLVVSECHRLTDQFAMDITQHAPQLVYLHLRYCKRLTDNGVNAIATGLQNLYSLDLSFCSKVTVQAICSLLQLRRETLSELRLQECHQLQIAQDADDIDYSERQGSQQPIARAGRDGQAILKTLRSPGGGRRGSLGTMTPQDSILSMLDLRRCGGQSALDVAYPEDAFVRSMKALQFEQKAPGFFARPARWNDNMQARLIEQLDTNHRIGL